MNEILDDFIEPDAAQKQKRINKTILAVSLVTAFLFTITFFLRGYLPENLFEWNGTEFKLFGIISFVIIILIVNYVVKEIVKIDDSKKSISVAFLGGATIFFADILYKVILNYIILRFGLETDLIGILRSAFILSVFGFLFSYSKVTRIRKENRLIPNLLFFAFIILIHFLVKYKLI